MERKTDEFIHDSCYSRELQATLTANSEATQAVLARRCHTTRSSKTVLHGIQRVVKEAELTGINIRDTTGHTMHDLLKAATRIQLLS